MDPRLHGYAGRRRRATRIYGGAEGDDADAAAIFNDVPEESGGTPPAVLASAPDATPPGPAGDADPGSSAEAAGADGIQPEQAPPPAAAAAVADVPPAPEPELAPEAAPEPEPVPDIPPHIDADGHGDEELLEASAEPPVHQPTSVWGALRASIMQDIDHAQAAASQQGLSGSGRRAHRITRWN
jgi:hypothetical protein